MSQEPIQNDKMNNRNKEVYCETGVQWLSRWDAGENVWSVVMGGLGAGYEKAIQITAAEALRWMVMNGPINWDDEKIYASQMEKMDAWLLRNKTVTDLGDITGAMMGAARNLAACLFRRGPAVALSDSNIQDRLIGVNKYGLYDV